MNSRQVGKLKVLLLEYKRNYIKTGNVNPSLSELINKIERQLSSRQLWAESQRKDHSQRGKDEG